MKGPFSNFLLPTFLSQVGVASVQLRNDRLDLQIGLERLLALVAPDAGALVAPEGQGGVAAWGGCLGVGRV